MYVGVTNNVERRMNEHYENRGNRQTFTGRYYCYNLVYDESHRYINNAIEREKEIKLLTRVKKEELIKEFNPRWAFLKVW